jgi:hypothetical protein
MALEHRTVIGGIQIERNGDVIVLLKLIVADGTNEFSETAHRIQIDKGTSVVAKLTAISTALTASGRAPIPTKAGVVIKNTAEACWEAMDA